VHRFKLNTERVEPEYLTQVGYALAFASEKIEAHGFSEEAGLWIEIQDPAEEAEVRGKVERLLERYARVEFGLKSVVHFSQTRELPDLDAWSALVEKRWIVPVGPGHFILRGDAARVYRMVNELVRVKFGGHFEAEEEVYPGSILCSTLDRINHFTSFPEHVDFVSHLQSDVDVLSDFSADCAEGEWRASATSGRLNPPGFAITPSCCYHCYEAMEGWNLDGSGRSVTVVSEVHRYEGRNQQGLSRMRAFHVRDVVWVGHPRYVIAAREEADRMIVDLAKRWQLDCTFENANDMFFTDDYAIKASFQRQQQAKRELKLTIPGESRSIAVFSSNFHASTFCKAFDIKFGRRVGVSACIGFGLERWVYALFAQHGLDVGDWPDALKADFQAFGVG